MVAPGLAYSPSRVDGGWQCRWLPGPRLWLAFGRSSDDRRGVFEGRRENVECVVAGRPGDDGRPDPVERPTTTRRPSGIQSSAGDRKALDHERVRFGWINEENIRLRSEIEALRAERDALQEERTTLLETTKGLSTPAVRTNAPNREQRRQAERRRRRSTWVGATHSTTHIWPCE